MLTGNNGILNQVHEAKTKTEKSSLIEQVRIDILGKEVEKQEENIDSTELQTILNKYFTNIPQNANDLIGYDENLEAKEEYGGYNDIKLSDIYQGTIERGKEIIDIEKSFVNYYADIDDDGVIDGIIYADLAKGKYFGHGALGSYTIEKEEGELKQYYIKETGKTDERFDTVARDVIAPVNKDDTSKKDRFYVMALEDFNDGKNIEYYWYRNTREANIDFTEITKKGFGEGKTNTANMIAKWKPVSEGGYGETDENDIWGVIQKADKNGKIWSLDKWFIPSDDEWRAFSGELNISSTNYEETYNLSEYYWSSSRRQSKFCKFCL